MTVSKARLWSVALTWAGREGGREGEREGRREGGLKGFYDAVFSCLSCYVCLSLSHSPQDH
jgi:hypothetical protein